MKVEFKINRTALDKLRQVAKNKFNALESAVLDEKSMIAVRTSKGQDVEGNTFAPYSTAWAKVRTEGRKSKDPKYRVSGGHQVSPPNLTITGQMLSSMQVGRTTITNNHASTQIFFGDSINANKARGNMKTRNFFALSKEQIQRIKKRIKEA